MKTINNSPTRNLIIAGLMLLAAFTRLIPHPANFTAVMALALFGGAKIKNQPLAFVIPLIVMLITDLVIGFYSLMPFVYGSIVLTVLIGKYVGRLSNPVFIIGGSLVSSIVFFLITNAAVWYHNPQYAQSLPGLMLCYDVAIPFFRNQVFGDLFFNFLLFGTFKIAQTKITSLAY